MQTRTFTGHGDLEVLFGQTVHLL